MTPAEILYTAANLLGLRHCPTCGHRIARNGIIDAIAEAGEGQPEATIKAFAYLHEVIGDKKAEIFEVENGAEKARIALREAAKFATS